MTFRSAKDLLASLEQARGIGLEEEPSTIAGVSMVFRSLRPDEHESILDDCKGREDAQYLSAFQRGHVARSLVELGDTDFRGVEYVHDEVDDPKTGKPKKVSLELHRWIEKNIVSTWSREVLYVAYLKVQDAIEKAVRRSREGVVFLVPEETAEEQVRRLMGDAAELYEDVPELVLEKILEEHGLMRRSKAEEIAAAQERMDTVAREQAAVEENTPTESPPDPTRDQRLEEALRNRRPVHEAVDVAPQPPPQQPPPRQPPQETPQAPPPPVPPQPPLEGRSARLAALAAQQTEDLGLPTYVPQVVGLDGASPTAPAVPGVPHRRLSPDQIAELRPTKPEDPEKAAREARGIIDQPPPAGINPRFRPPRLGGCRGNRSAEGYLEGNVRGRASTSTSGGGRDKRGRRACVGSHDARGQP